MKSSIYVKRQSFEVQEFSVISFVLITFCQPEILRNSARDVTDIFGYNHSASTGIESCGPLFRSCDNHEDNKHYYKAEFCGSRNFQLWFRPSTTASAKMKYLLLYLSFLGLSLAFKFPISNPRGNQVKDDCYKPEFDKNIAEVM